MSLTTRNFAFRGCGWLMGFHLGVMHALREEGVLNFEKGSKLSVASGGAIVGSCFAAGLSTDVLKEAIVKANEENRAAGFLKGWGMRLDKVIGGILEDLLPLTCHDDVKGRIVIPTRIVSPRAQRGNAYHDTFKSKEDLINLVVASSYIPFYTGPRGGYYYEGVYHADGAVTPISLCDSFVHVSIRARTMIQTQAEIIYPTDDGVLSMARGMAFPQNRATVEKAVEDGIHAAERWMESQRLRTDVVNHANVSTWLR